ncbi:uncharacterized protein [Euwallacea similis]|uniref:uncharacterized protein n=1 Tax=Euwallacea similis TaxID=1736056 RepID=UPI00344D8D2A
MGSLSAQILLKHGPMAYMRVTKNRGKEVFNLLHRSFYRNEDISVALGISNHEECFPEFDKMVKWQLKQGLSIAAVDTDSDRVVAVAINFIYNHSNIEDFYKAQIEASKHPVSRKNFQFIMDVNKFFNIWEFCKVDMCFESWLDVAPEYRKRGIAKKLSELTIDFAKAMKAGNDITFPIDDEELKRPPDQPEIISVISTSGVSEKLVGKLGFKCAAKVNLNGFVYDGIPLSDKIQNEDYLGYYYLRL